MTSDAALTVMFCTTGACPGVTALISCGTGAATDGAVHHRRRGAGGMPPRPVLAEARTLGASAPSVEPGTTRLQVTVSGTIQLQP